MPSSGVPLFLPGTSIAYFRPPRTGEQQRNKKLPEEKQIRTGGKNRSGLQIEKALKIW
jgi:hypothetical protein